MADLKCKFCGEDLPKILENGNRRHGNQKYHKLCYELEKQNRQISKYSRGRKEINQLVKNDSILEYLYNSLNTNKLISWIDLLKEGFDHKLYTGEDKVNDSVIKREFNYGFQVINKEGRVYIKIHKL